MCIAWGVAGASCHWYRRDGFCGRWGGGGAWRDSFPYSVWPMQYVAYELHTLPRVAPQGRGGEGEGGEPCIRSKTCR